MIANIFHISFDELMRDEDVKSLKLLEERKAKKFYWLAIGGFAIAVIFTLLSNFLQNKLFLIGSAIGILIYVFCAYFCTPKYKRVEKSTNKNNSLLKILIALLLLIIFISVIIF